jgi:hypothetical protein
LTPLFPFNSSMKHFLLTLLLLGAAGSAQAQLVNIISTGVRVGVSAAAASRSGAGARNYVELADPRAPRPDINVAAATYRGQSYPQKRTPPARLNGPGGEQIAAHEALLQTCQAALTADSTGAIGTAAIWAKLKSSADAIARDRPTWNVQPYRDEAAFYEAEAARRQRVAEVAPH